jgi:hypothetical protein
MIETTIKEIHALIQKQNAIEELTAVPHSDDFARSVQSLMGVSTADLKMYVNILKEAHMVFVFEIVRDDPDHDVKKVEGYVDADLPTIIRLKNFYQKKLMEEYENRYKKRLLVHQIVKEIFPQIRLLNNTSLGFLANKAIMLEEYENLMEKEYTQYSDAWKDSKLQEILNEQARFSSRRADEAEKSPDGSADRGGPLAPNRRAVDSDEYHEYQSKHSKEAIRKMLKVYGVDFFYRVQLRNTSLRRSSAPLK